MNSTKTARRSMDGISVHADSAAVNLNFWITPDEANLDPSSGGLVVYPKMPPQSASSSSSSSDVPQEDSPSGGNVCFLQRVMWYEKCSIYCSVLFSACCTIYVYNMVCAIWYVCFVYLYGDNSLSRAPARVLIQSSHGLSNLLHQMHFAENETT